MVPIDKQLLSQDTILWKWKRTARTLSEALPYLQRYDKKTIVIKYGGHAITSVEQRRGFARDIVLLKQCGINPVIVHGGGPQINQMLEKLSIPIRFHKGRRITDAESMRVVEMILTGAINKSIISDINIAGGMGIGICGKDARLITAMPIQMTGMDEAGQNIDFGFTGQPTSINTTILRAVQDTDIIPVIAPIGTDLNGQAYNINADTVAGAIAAAVGAERLLLLTDVEGVRDKDGNKLKELCLTEAENIIQSGAASGGMVPKLETCIQAVHGGVSGAVILDGRLENAVLLELFTQMGIGTLLTT